MTTTAVKVRHTQLAGDGFGIAVASFVREWATKNQNRSEAWIGSHRRFAGIDDLWQTTNMVECNMEEWLCNIRVDL